MTEDGHTGKKAANASRREADPEIVDRLYEVDVLFVDEYGETHHMTDGEGNDREPFLVLARNVAEARSEATDHGWDARLSSASCRPSVEVNPIKRYAICKGWANIFPGKAPPSVLTRWVIDRAADDFVTVQVLEGPNNSNAWVELDSSYRETFKEALHGAGAVWSDEDYLDEIGVKAANRLAAWAVPAAAYTEAYTAAGTVGDAAETDASRERMRG